MSGVEVALLVGTLGCGMANAAVAGADLLPARFVLANINEVGLPPRMLPVLALLKGAGAMGLLLGLIGLRPLGLAAAVGLTLFYVGAVGAHVRRSVFHNIGFPLAFLGLALSAVGHFAVSLG